MIFKDVNFDDFNKEVSRGKDTQRFQNWALESAKIERRETSQGIKKRQLVTQQRHRKNCA